MSPKLETPFISNAATFCEGHQFASLVRLVAEKNKLKLVGGDRSIRSTSPCCLLGLALPSVPGKKYKNGAVDAAFNKFERPEGRHQAVVECLDAAIHRIGNAKTRVRLEATLLPLARCTKSFHIEFLPILNDGVVWSVWFTAVPALLVGST